MANNYDQPDYDGMSLQQSVIGILLSYSNVELVKEVTEVLAPEVFTNLVYRRAFKACMECYDKDELPTLVTVDDKIRTGDTEADQLTFNLMAEAAKNSFSHLSIKNHADKLVQYLKARRIIESLNNSNDFIKNSTDPDQVIEFFSRSLDSMAEYCHTQINEDLLISGSDGFDVNVDWLIKGWVPANSFGMVYGPSGSYKSFCMIDWAASIATGMSWNDAKVDKGAVLYIAAEGQAGIAGRVKAWEIISDTKTPNLKRYNRGCDVTCGTSRRTILGACDQVKKLTGLPVKAIIIDTVNRCFGEGDENSTKDMTAFVQGCDRLKEKTGATIICVHHTGKDADKGARGSSVLKAACDFEHLVIKNPAIRGYVIRCTKAKEFEEPEPLQVKLETIDLGTKDSDGHSKTSLARTSKAKPAREDSTAGGSIKTSIIDMLMQNDGQRPRTFVVDHLAVSMNGKLDSNKQQIRREIKRMIDDDVLSDSAGMVYVNQEVMTAFDSGQF